jgi:Mg/Co/Ni transporter MgtE
MSGAPDASDEVHSAVPVADLTAIDDALARGPAELKAAVKQVRPADLGRDLARRPMEDARKLMAAIDDRRGAAMLRAAHPMIAAQLLGELPPSRTCHVLAFIPTDHEVAILAKMSPARRAEVEQAYSADEKAQITRLLAYPESAVGRLMTPKIWRCDKSRGDGPTRTAACTAGDAMAILREAAN